MSDYSLTPLARADIFDIWSYIAEHSNSEETANRVEQAIYDACAFVAEAPMRGHSRSDLTSRPLRFWGILGGRRRGIPPFRKRKVGRPARAAAIARFEAAKRASSA